MKSKHRSMLHHQVRDTAGVDNGMKVYGEGIQHCLHGYGVAGRFPSRGRSLVNFMELMIRSVLLSIPKSIPKNIKVGINSK